MICKERQPASGAAGQPRRARAHKEPLAPHRTALVRVVARLMELRVLDGEGLADRSQTTIQPAFLIFPALVIVARQSLTLRDALVFDRGLEHTAIAQLIDQAALDFLPWRLVGGVFVAAGRLERGATLGNFVV